MLHGPQKEVFNLRFALPSECADLLASGDADIGIIPAIEMARQQLSYFPGTGIACHGPVRSILLISKVPWREIRTVATDSGSRTSVMLARIILAEKFGVTPQLISRPAALPAMLDEADAALLIGDAALHVDPATLPFESLDLGAEWNTLTGLPMVFAVWSGRPEIIQDRYQRAFSESCSFGLANIPEIAHHEAPLRGIGEKLARLYLTRHIVFQLGERDYSGMNLYLEKAAKLDRVTVAAGAPKVPPGVPA